MTSEGTQNELLSQVVQEQLRKSLGLNVTIEVLTITERPAPIRWTLMCASAAGVRTTTTR